jgi:hypothetical protein
MNNVQRLFMMSICIKIVHNIHMYKGLFMAYTSMEIAYYMCVLYKIYKGCLWRINLRRLHIICVYVIHIE